MKKLTDPFICHDKVKSEYLVSCVPVIYCTTQKFNICSAVVIIEYYFILYSIFILCCTFFSYTKILFLYFIFLKNAFQLHDFYFIKKKSWIKINREAKTKILHWCQRSLLHMFLPPSINFIQGVWAKEDENCCRRQQCIDWWFILNIQEQGILSGLFCNVPKAEYSINTCIYFIYL